MQTNDYKSIIDNADYLRSLVKKPGWKIIQKFMADKREYYTQVALTEKDMHKIYYAQAYVSIIDTINYEIDMLIKQGDEAGEISK